METSEHLTNKLFFYSLLEFAQIFMCNFALSQIVYHHTIRLSFNNKQDSLLFKFFVVYFVAYFYSLLKFAQISLCNFALCQVVFHHIIRLYFLESMEAFSRWEIKVSHFSLVVFLCYSP